MIVKRYPGNGEEMVGDFVCEVSVKIDDGADARLQALVDKLAGLRRQAEIGRQQDIERMKESEVRPFVENDFAPEQVALPWPVKIFRRFMPYAEVQKFDPDTAIVNLNDFSWGVTWKDFVWNESILDEDIAPQEKPQPDIMAETRRMLR